MDKITCLALPAGNAVKIVTNTGKTFMIPTNKPAELSRVINSLFMQKLENRRIK